MKKSIFKGKSTRTKIFAAISMAGIALLLCLNLLLTYVFSQKLVIIDLTPEGFYTLSDKMKEVCSEILNKKDENGKKKQIEITFCCEPDYLTGNNHMRTTYFMALGLQKMFDNVTVKTVDVLRNPTAVSKYKTTSNQSIGTTDMIVSYGAKYRIVDADSFWTSNDFSYDGEYRMAAILASLTAIDQPVAYFLVGHGETYYDIANPDSEMSISTGSLYDLLTERGLAVKLLDLGITGCVPEDCALLIVNNPRTDLATSKDNYDRFDYVSEAEMLDRYLVNNAGGMIVNKGYDVDLPVFESLMAEWGIGFGDSIVKDVDNCLEALGERGTTILGVYDMDENGIGGAYYSEYSELDSAPKMVFSDTGYVYNAYGKTEEIPEPGGYNTTRVYNHFIGTSDTAKAYDYLDGGLTAGEGRKSLAALSVRQYIDSTTGNKVYSYLFCTNSASFFSNEMLGNASYANYAVMATVISDLSRTDRFASSELGGSSLNSPSPGGKQTVSTVLTNTDTDVYSSDENELIAVNRGFGRAELAWFSVIVFAVPVTVLGFGIAVYIKRKFL